MPKMAAHDYDPAFRPWTDKTAMTIGMGMTERQGGTDVRTNTTRAEPAGDGYVRQRRKVVHVGADVRRRFWCWRRPTAG